MAFNWYGRNLRRQGNTFHSQFPRNQTVQNVTLYKNETSISEFYREVKDSVVTIQGIVTTASSIGQVQGSGFLYNYSGQIVIVTNFYVVNNVKNVSVTSDNGNAYPAMILGSDVYADLAVLQLGQIPSDWIFLSH